MLSLPSFCKPAETRNGHSHVNEFEFRDGKIARRIVTADYGNLREIVNES